MYSDCFEFSLLQKTRGHAYKLYKPRSNCTARSRFFFAERVVNVWNDLPSTVNFASLASFKRTVRDVDFHGICDAINLYCVIYGRPM